MAIPAERAFFDELLPTGNIGASKNDVTRAEVPLFTHLKGYLLCFQVNASYIPK